MTTASGFDSPQQAAMDGFPARYCRVVDSAINDDNAFVLLDTGSDGRAYLYGVQCFRKDGRWHEAASSNGGCWSHSGPGELGMLAFVDEAPRNADAVRVEFNGNVREVEVRYGAFLAAWWGVPSPDWKSAPRAAAFRIDGEWVQ
jgi:hypothetical protein